MRLILIAMIALLALAAVLQWRDWPPTLPAVPAAGSLDLPELPEQPSFTLDDERARDDYLSVVERPLFLPDRRPPQSPAPVDNMADGAEVPADEELTGVDVNAILINTEARRSVWLVDPSQGNELIRKRLGDDFKGWVIKDIEADRVRFERQGRIETLDLLDFSASSQRRLPVRPNSTSRRPPVRRSPQTASDSQAGPSHDR
jgi:general secretion pathway protein N